MISVVKIINGVKTLVPLDKTAVTDLDLTTQNNAILKFNRSENRVVDSGFKTDIIPSSASANNKLLVASDVVNEVASGNLHSVSSNAVARNNIHAIRDYWTTDINNPFDVLSIIGSYGDLLEGMSEEIKIRIGSFVTNSPLGSGVQDSDMFYLIRKISVSNNYWIRVTAIDVRSASIYTICKRDGVWQTWQPIHSDTENSATLNTEVAGSGNISWAKIGRLVQVNIYNLILNGWTGGDKTIATGLPISRNRTYFSIPIINSSNAPQLFSIEPNGSLLSGGGEGHAGTYYGSCIYLSAS